MNKQEKEVEKNEVIEAWRTLYYLDFFSDKQKESIRKKIDTRYKINR